jgi:uncharacterized protein (UPF0548 family)
MSAPGTTPAAGATTTIVTTGHVPAGARHAFAQLHDKGLNFTPLSWDRACADPSWHTDEESRLLAVEPPGEPVTDGPFERARAGLIRYESADPKMVRAVYDAAAPFDGRDMLLVGRFLVLRFHMGVRVGDVVDEHHTRDGDPVHRFAWNYSTLEGHLEQGRMVYDLCKHESSGEVRLTLRAYSRRGPIRNPIVRLGFVLFARREQLRFYARTLDRMQAIASGHPDPRGTIARWTSH